MARPFRRGACPTLGAPMQTGDGWLARFVPVRPLTPAQLAGLAVAAARLGSGRIEVTARGSLQVRGLTPASAAALADAAAALGIAVAAGVPVLCGPLAGLDPAEVADPRPLAAEIASRAAGLARRLAPKVSVVVDGGGRLHLDAVPADVRLTAVAGGWRVAAGDRAIGLMEAGAAFEAAVALLERLAAVGPAARGRELAVAAVAVAAPERAPATAVGRIPLRTGVALGIGLPFGQSDSGTLAALAEAAPPGARFAPAPGRVLLALGLAPAEADALAGRAAGLGLLVDPADPRLGIVACSGAPACARAELATRALAAAIAAERPELIGAGLHLSGCAKRCAQPTVPATTFVGRQAADGPAASAALRAFVAEWVE